MASTKAAKSYAKAIFALAGETDKLDRVRGDLLALAKLREQSSELKSFFSHPLITTERRSEIIKKLFDEKLDPLTVRFLLFLELKGRLEHLADICEEVEASYYELKGILRVQMTAAKAPEGDQVEQILQRLRDRFSKEIELAVEIEPELLGGFQLQVGDTVYDSSIRTKLLTFQQKLINA